MLDSDIIRNFILYVGCLPTYRYLAGRKRSMVPWMLLPWTSYEVPAHFHDDVDHEAHRSYKKELLFLICWEHGEPPNSVVLLDVVLRVSVLSAQLCHLCVITFHDKA